MDIEMEKLALCWSPLHESDNMNIDNATNKMKI